MKSMTLARGAALLALCFGASLALAKLPPPPTPSPEAKAKAAETAAKTAWSGKVDAYKLCLSQDKAAEKYRANMAAAGKPTPAPITTPACADPGPFAYTPPPLEAAGAHSPPATAAAPPSSNQPAAAAPKQQ